MGQRKSYLLISFFGAVFLVFLFVAYYTPSRTSAAEDVTPPQVTTFSITPTEFNTGSSEQMLTLNITLTDDLSGVSTWYDEGGHGMTQVRLRPLIGTQMADFWNLSRVSGNALNGTYTATTTVPAYAKVGVWQVEYLYLADKIGNTQYLYTNDLISLLPGAQGISIVNTAEANSVTIEREWTLSSANASVTFPLNTVVTRQEGGSFAFYRMVNQEFSLDGLPTTDLTGIPVGTVRFGIPGLNLNFSKNVSVTISVDPAYNGYTLFIQSLEENGQSWANEETSTVADGMLSFTVNHATYFAANALRSRPRGSILINNDRPLTSSKYVTLNLRAVDRHNPVAYMRFSNNGKRWTRWRTYKRRYHRWNLASRQFGGTSAKGEKYVYVKFKNKAGFASAVKKRDSIIYR